MREAVRRDAGQLIRERCREIQTGVITELREHSDNWKHGLHDGASPTWRPARCPPWAVLGHEGVPAPRGYIQSSTWEAADSWQEFRALLTHEGAALRYLRQGGDPPPPHPASLRPVDCLPTGSSVHGILQARIRDRAAICSFRGSSPPEGQTLSCIAGGFFITSATWEALNAMVITGLPGSSAGKESTCNA